MSSYSRGLTLRHANATFNTMAALWRANGRQRMYVQLLWLMRMQLASEVCATVWSSWSTAVSVFPPSARRLNSWFHRYNKPLAESTGNKDGCCTLNNKLCYFLWMFPVELFTWSHPSNLEKTWNQSKFAQIFILSNVENDCIIFIADISFRVLVFLPSAARLFYRRR